MRRLLQRFKKKAPSPNITIVSGLPRSGTSLMMKMLETGGIPPLIDKIRTADDDNPKGYYEYERVKALKDDDTAWLPEAQGKVVKIIFTLLPYLPPTCQYRAIFMLRSLSEILASQKKMLVRRGEDPDKISDAEMTVLYQKHMREVYNWVNQQANFNYIEINYNELMEAPAPQIEKINTFLGGSLDAQKMATVIDPSLYRQRKI